MRRKAFTLIELLVVIAIIAILASILMVGLSAVLKATYEDTAQTACNNLATSMQTLKKDYMLYHKPMACFIDTSTFVDPKNPTLVELQTRAAKFNIALELCPKAIWPDVAYESPPNGHWPYVNAHKKSRALATNQINSYDFGTYYDPKHKQLAKYGAAVTQLIDPWEKPYYYLIFEEDQNVMQADGVTLVSTPIFFEVIASAGPDGLLDITKNFSSTGGFLDFSAHPNNEDNLYAVVDKWSPNGN